jgi:hypothetical protein
MAPHLPSDRLPVMHETPFVADPWTRSETREREADRT